MKSVIFSSELSTTERRVYKAATILFIAVFFAFMWPIYPLFNRVRPLVLGMPASLFYLVFLLSVAFVAISALYRWEDRHGKLDEPPEPPDLADPEGRARRSRTGEGEDGDKPGEQIPGPSDAAPGRD